MTEDKNQDRTQSEGQEGIDRETELRNRENEKGQQSGQNQQFGQQGGQPRTDQGGQSPSDQDRGSSAFGQQGQSAGGDTTLSERAGQTGDQSSSGEASSQKPEGFLGSGNDNSSDYVTKGEEDQDFAALGQGAEDGSAARSDVETGQSTDQDSDIEGSGTDR